MAWTTRTDEERFSELRQELAPELELIRVLGKGSVANVYLAREPALWRMVAVKVLRDDVARDEIVRARFEREAQTAASVRHLNVISIYRVGRTHEGVPYIVMEYIEGRTLGDLLAARGPCQVGETRRVLSSVAFALDAVHRKDIVHRDVRPDNVMLEAESGRVVLMDFGIVALLETGSKSVHHLTTEIRRIGDPLHMSPEQRRGNPVTPQSDVYSLGVLAHDLLLGRPPHDEQPPPLRQLREDVDAELSELITSCMSMEPDRRPRVVEVAEVLASTRTVLPAGGNKHAAEPGSFAAFLHELARRRVYRVAVGYAAAGWVMLQLPELLAAIIDDAHEETWNQALIAVVLAGFPAALAMAWLFDITAAGIRRADQGEPAPTRRSRRALVLPLVGLVLSMAIAFGIWLLLMR